MKLLTLLKKLGSKKNKRGVSIVEAAVAITVISLISFVAADFLTRFATVSARTVYRTEARYATENALECFKFSVDNEQFGLFVKHAGFEKSPDDSSASGEVYIKKAVNYKITVTVSFDGVMAEFSALAVENSGKEILKIENYERILDGGSV